MAGTRRAGGAGPRAKVIRMIAGVLVLGLMTGCLKTLGPIGTPAQVVSHDGQGYPLRVVANEAVPGVPGATRAAVRIVAPDAATASAIYRQHCGLDAPTPWRDTRTGEFVVPGPCPVAPF